MKKVVVVLPTYNERDNLEDFVKEILDQEKNLPGYKIEIVISDSHSPDGTGEIAEKLSAKNFQIHYIDVERGLGIGLIEGHLYSLKRCHPDVMAQLDADGQVEVEVLPKLVKAIEDGYNLALGSRFVPGGKNKLSFSRRIFTSGASFVCRLIMGPWNIKEFTNSARAFTPALFKKINLKRLPWREKSFIVQPAFLNECILAGARYKEVPLVFKNRAEGYSKNKVLNYIYDTLAYCIDARLHKLGIKISLFKISRRFRTFFKFGLVGLAGTAVDFIFYKFFIAEFFLPPAIAKLLSATIAIQNNFTLNNLWTFRNRKTKTSLWQKLITFNLVSSGGVLLSALIIFLLHRVYGDGFRDFWRLHLAYNTIYFLVTIPPVMAWNFTMNHLFTWKHHEEELNAV